MSAIRFHPETTVVATSDQISSALAGEVVILNLAQGAYFGLDAVGARIWELIQTPQAVTTICTTLLAEYEVSPEQCTEDVLALLAQLHDAELIKVGV